MIYPHQRYKNVEIASVDVEKKVISLTVHYEGNEADLEDYEVQNKLTADVNAAMKHFKDQRFFEDDACCQTVATRLLVVILRR